MKDTIKYLVWIFAIVPFLIACGDSNTDGSNCLQRSTSPKAEN